MWMLLFFMFMFLLISLLSLINVHSNLDDVIVDPLSDVEDVIVAFNAHVSLYST